MQKEAFETVENLLRKRLVSRITKVYLRKTSEETLLYWQENQRHPSDINNSFRHHQRGMSKEKHMDWWTASTKPILQPYAIENCSTIALTKERLQMSLAAPFLTRDVAQTEERSLSMRERGSMPPASPIFQRSPEIKKPKTERRHGFIRPICERKHLKQYRACWASDWCPESPRFTSERRRRKHYYTNEWIKDISLT